MWKAMVLACGFGMLAGCASLSKGGQQVLVVNSESAVKGCRFVGYEQATSGLRGPASFRYAEGDMEIRLRNKAAKDGGDTLLLERSEVSWNDESSASGKAYDCKDR